jgi:broad-specificity NMP kinase
MENDVIIIKGAPCAGKSETAKALSAYFPKGVRMEVDIIRFMVISVNWKNQKEHINMLQLSANIVHGFLNFNLKPVIVVDTFSGDKINGFLDTLYKLNNDLSIKIFGLYLSEEELKNRIELRPDDKFKNFEICKNINDDVLKLKNKNEILIDTTGQTAEETAKKIFDVLINSNPESQLICRHFENNQTAQNELVN